MPEFIENAFERVGLKAANRPKTYIALSVLVSACLGYGFTQLLTENRPEKQWVPTGAVALDHQVYTSATWPSRSRVNLYTVTCKKKPCNLLEAKYVRELQKVHSKVENLELDGDKMQRESEAIIAGTKPKDQLKTWDVANTGLKTNVPAYHKEFTSRKLWPSFKGKWRFSYGDDLEVQQKCFKFGPFCGMSTPLQVFRNDAKVLENLTDKQAMQAWNFWENQEQFCPVSVATEDSPCVDTARWKAGAGKNDCQLYKTPAQRANCRDAANAYCNAKCPGLMPGDKCMDNGCPTLRAFNNITPTQATNATANGTATGAPDSAFAFSPFKLRTVASSGMQMKEVSSTGKAQMGPVFDPVSKEYKSAEAMMGFFAISFDPEMVNTDSFDPVAEQWELQALCMMGIHNPRNGLSNDGYYRADGTWTTEKQCPGSDLLEFSAFFNRSLGDEFGAAIVGDLGALGGAYVLIIGYMVLMLSKRDHVNSKMNLGLIAVLIIGLSYACCIGLGAFIGWRNNNLNNFIPFLLLGLGVDDAFVLKSEFDRAKKQHPKKSVEEQCAIALRYGGSSVMITSITDLMAFAFGALTRLPALGWFCSFTALGVLFLFIFQVTVFIPFLCIDEKRARRGVYDGTCCCATCCGVVATPSRDDKCCVPSRKQGWWARTFPGWCNSRHDVYERALEWKGAADKQLESEKAGLKDDEYRQRQRVLKENFAVQLHPYDEPRGCCACCHSPPDRLPEMLKRWAQLITTRGGTIFTLVFFLASYVAAGIGAGLIYQDFKLEWFIPSDSYVQNFYRNNDNYFRGGTQVTVFVKDIDYFKHQAKLHKLEKYLRTSNLVDQDIEVESWFKEFHDGANANDIDNPVVKTNAAGVAVRKWFADDVAVTVEKDKGSTDGEHRFVFKSEAAFYKELHEWYDIGGGARYRTRMQWQSAGCEKVENWDKFCYTNEACAAQTWTRRPARCQSAAVNDDDTGGMPGGNADDANCAPLRTEAGCTATDGADTGKKCKWYPKEMASYKYCDPALGVKASRVSFTLALDATDQGTNRYATMTQMRADVRAIMGTQVRGANAEDDNAFPYAFDFLYWEETGVIGYELVKNLISCGIVIVLMISLLIPDKKVAPIVIFTVAAGVINLIGFLHWWDVTISGVSTIYILLSVGLAVDYAAHVAHMFVVANGSAKERAVASMERIGPSAFNACVSTLLAVVVLSTSKSFVMVIFFKALALICVWGGAHGLWLLPVLLAIFGGEKHPDSGKVTDLSAGIVVEDNTSGKNNNADGENDSKTGLKLLPSDTISTGSGKLPSQPEQESMQVSKEGSEKGRSSRKVSPRDEGVLLNIREGAGEPIGV